MNGLSIIIVVCLVETALLLKKNDQPAITECPLLNCVQNCDNGYILDDNGCPTCTCLCLKQITCKRNCGNWGYKTDEQGCPLCECNCPLRRCWQQCGDLGYKADEYGCMGCECNCPLVKCSTQCAYGFKQNDYGCQTCQCACETLGCKRK
ncbi:unnamed protein product [Didymodactylos carnosus]|uniref:Antistasin-like domain-containing protein n=1 Tax=Didymodactylos carnosus TaxID=1234261 RepID=A0A8S2F8B2_9BILA|nr:unnamed protein product [Didymodactylos carnosus]CAF4201955.1 unnamed protein product [Didymodactylos carnosus]